MIRPFIAFVFVLALADSRLQADLMTYTLTGSIQDVGVRSVRNDLLPSTGPFPVAVGDRISWTLQYDRSTPLASSAPSSLFTSNDYYPAGPLILHLVDQTNGYQIPTARPGSIPATGLSPQHPMDTYSGMGLLKFPKSATVSFLDSQPITRNGVRPYSVQLILASNAPLPTMNLAQLQLDRLPLRFNDKTFPAENQFNYSWPHSNQNTFSETFNYFDAVVSSLSPAESIQAAPEPGSLCLLALSFLGLALRRLRCGLCYALRSAKDWFLSSAAFVGLSRRSKPYFSGKSRRHQRMNHHARTWAADFRRETNQLAPIDGPGLSAAFAADSTAHL